MEVIYANCYYRKVGWLNMLSVKRTESPLNRHIRRDLKTQCRDSKDSTSLGPNQSENASFTFFLNLTRLILAPAELSYSSEAL